MKLQHYSHYLPKNKNKNNLGKQTLHVNIYQTIFESEEKFAKVFGSE